MASEISFGSLPRVLKRGGTKYTSAHTHTHTYIYIYVYIYIYSLRLGFRV